MGFLHFVAQQNHYTSKDFQPLWIEDKIIGWLTPQIYSTLLGYNNFVTPHIRAGLSLNPNAKNYTQRSELFEEIITQLVGVDELPPQITVVSEYQDVEGLCQIKRFYAVYFGIEVTGVALNVYQHPYVWLGVRGVTRHYHPNKLDCLAGGCAEAGLTLLENIYKEAREEAGLSDNYINQIKAVGFVQLCFNDIHGHLWREKIYCYDLHVDNNFEPQLVAPEEVAAFKKTHIDDVLQWLESADLFKPNIALVMIDFCIRHGYIGPDHPSYDAALDGLRPNLKALETCP